MNRYTPTFAGFGILTLTSLDWLETILKISLLALTLAYTLWRWRQDLKGKKKKSNERHYTDPDSLDP